MSVIDIWWISLAIFTLVIVVVALLLGLIVAAAKSIDRQAAGIWMVGKQIAGNTVSIWMLQQASRYLRETRDEARQIHELVRSTGETLQALARPGERG